MNTKIILVCFMLGSIIVAGCLPLTYSSAENNYFSNVVYESWSKEAFLKAEERLKNVYAGMPAGEFYELIQMQTLLRGKKVIDVFADGFIRPLGGEVQEDEGLVTEIVFGYVMRGIMVEKIVVQIKNDKVYRIIDLETKDLGPIDMREVKIKGNEYWVSKESYLRAKENLKNIAIGMNKRKALIKMDGSMMLVDNQDFFVASGYLRNKYLEQKIDGKVVEEFHFGYVENGEEITGFIVKAINNRVSEIIFLEKD